MGVRTTLADGEGSASLRLYGADIARLPKELRSRLRPRMREAGEITMARARANAAWSSRIPRALSLRVSFARRDPGVTIIADTSAAPHARPLEGITSEGSFRHPVFGNDVWVTQATRPFLRPAAQATGGDVVAKVAEAIDDATRAVGFR